MIDLLDLMQDNFTPEIEHIEDAILCVLTFTNEDKDHESELTINKEEILHLRDNAHKLYRLLGEFTDYA